MRINHNTAFEYYQKGIYPACDQLYAIGDIHGDFNAFVTVLKKAHLINDKYHWIGKNAHVVQVGDILDRKPRDINATDEDSEFRIISLILQLQLEAFHSGGGFHPVIGNHEIMNVFGMFDYVSPMGLLHFGNFDLRKKYFKVGGEFCRYLACGWNPIVKFGDVLFCHGGISPKIAQKYTIQEVNMIMRDTLYGNDAHMKENYFHELFMNPNSILWNRNYSSEMDYKKEMIEQRNIDKVLTTYDAKYMVVGHTPQMNGIKKKLGGKVFCVDTGMSEAFGRKNKRGDRIHYLLFLKPQNKIYFM